MHKLSQPIIYVATIIDSHNYGTCMQAVATRDVLVQYGKPVFIDYCRPQWTKSGWVKSYLGNASMIFPKRVVRLILNAPVRSRTRSIFRSFIERELDLCLARPYLTKNNELNPSAVYCVGSDQTWNIECNYGIDPVYFLTNVPNDCKKISFAASFGRPELMSDEIHLIKPLLQQFTAISVRENSSIAILESMGLDGAAIKDPVLLCRSELWHELSADIPKHTDDYVLVYMLNENPRMCAFAKKLADTKGMSARIVTFSPYRNAPVGLESVCLPRPEEWIALFRDASYVITDSFHGTCFSLVFEHPMIVFDPPEFSVRLKDVLHDFALDARRVANGNDADDIADSSIDWDHIRVLKKEFRNEARRFLDDVFATDEEDCGGK